jgi:hypothetical protein
MRCTMFEYGASMINESASWKVCRQLLKMRHCRSSAMAYFAGL